MIRVRRVYDPPEPADGVRVLVDRLWPRGLSKARARIDHWYRDLAPSDALRRWFGHDPARWDEFRRRYREELVAAGRWEQVRALAAQARRQTVTLLFAAKDIRHNNAVALAEILRRVAAGRQRR
ncbi:MAG: DUF488 family protein [Armatimonadota bacterium]|nr:DUF488 family protein [Armatimonadota bacterium]